MARLSDRQRRKAREEFDRRRRSSTDSTVTSGTNFDSWLTNFVIQEAVLIASYADSSSSSSYDSGSITDSGTSSYDSGSSSSDSGSSSSDSGSSYSDGGGGGSW